MNAPAANDPATVWEAAYLRYTPPQVEVQEFADRLLMAGAGEWAQDAEILEFFCGRGSGLVALTQLGFTRLTGADLSERLLAVYKGPARLLHADVRHLPVPDASFDVVFSQDGLHHMPVFPDDVEAVLIEMKRVLKPGGRAVILEPWLTPRLAVFRAMARSPLLRRLWPRLDAFAIMGELEYPRYDEWLSRPDEILSLIKKHFTVDRHRVRPGQVILVGRK